MEVSAGSVHPEEVEAVCALAASMRADLATHRGGRVWAAREARSLEAASISARAAEDPASVLVGRIDDVAVGFALIAPEEIDGALLARCDAIFVEEAAREVGVGEALLDAALDTAARWGAIGLDALVLPGDRQAKNFFEAAGLVARAIVVHRSLAP